jgi:hypothetical protein
MPITTAVVTQECEAHQDGEADGDLRPDHHTSSSCPGILFLLFLQNYNSLLFF